MKIVRVDKLGRIVIPIAYRRALDLTYGSELEIEMNTDTISIRRAADCCKLCYGRIENRLGIGLCDACIKKVKGSEL